MFRPEQLVLNSFQNLSRIVFERLNTFLVHGYEFHTARPLSTVELLDEQDDFSLLNEIFPVEMEKLRSLTREALENILKAEGQVAEAFKRSVRTFLSGQLFKLEDLDLTPSVEKIESVQSDLISPILKLSQELEQLKRDVLTISANRSFAAAVNVQLALNRKLQILQTSNIRLRPCRAGETEYPGLGNVSPLHMALARLADRGFSYMLRFGRFNDLLKHLTTEGSLFLEELKKRLRTEEALNKIYVALKENEDFKLKGMFLSWLRDCGAPEKLRGSLAEYFSELILALRDASVEANMEADLDMRLLESYVNVMIVNYGFIEYEIFSFLIDKGVPAIPKIFVMWNEEESGIIMKEIDILSLNLENDITVIDVTISTNPNELKSKCKDIEKLNFLGTPIILAPKKTISSLLKQGHCIYPKCIPIENPRQLLRELEASKRISPARLFSSVKLAEAR